MSAPLPFSLDPQVVDYAQRSDAAPFAEAASGRVTAAPPLLRAPLVISGIGMQQRRTDQGEPSRTPSQPLRTQMEQVLIGLHRQGVPFAYQVLSWADRPSSSRLPGQPAGPAWRQRTCTGDERLSKACCWPPTPR